MESSTERITEVEEYVGMWESARCEVNKHIYTEGASGSSLHSHYEWDTEITRDLSILKAFLGFEGKHIVFLMTPI